MSTSGRCTSSVRRTTLPPWLVGSSATVGAAAGAGVSPPGFSTRYLEILLSILMAAMGRDPQNLP
jgi:hypothetical protein